MRGGTSVVGGEGEGDEKLLAFSLSFSLEWEGEEGREGGRGFLSFTSNSGKVWSNICCVIVHFLLICVLLWYLLFLKCEVFSFDSIV